MLLMVMERFVIERFRNQDAEAVYRRPREQGPPERLAVPRQPWQRRSRPLLSTMQASNVTLLQRWADWSDLAQFEIEPAVAGSATAAALAASL